MMLHVDKPYSHIEHNTVSGCMVHTWKGYFLEDEYREAMTQCLWLMNQTGAKSLIINLQAANHEYWNENAWTAEQWFPELIRTDLGKLAIVVSDSPSAATFFFQADSDRLVASRYFNRLEDAHEWIARNGS